MALVFDVPTLQRIPRRAPGWPSILSAILRLYGRDLSAVELEALFLASAHLRQLPSWKQTRFKAVPIIKVGLFYSGYSLDSLDLVTDIEALSCAQVDALHALVNCQTTPNPNGRLM